jgi:hypothetical protein
MKLCAFFGWIAAAMAALAAAQCHSQELRCYTSTKDISKGTERPFEIARNLTLFHAGKVYDYIDSAALQEVTIYEPFQKRFVVLHTASGAAAEISQDEVRHYLSLARQAVEQDLAQPQPNTPSQSLDLLQFQLQPRFETRVDDGQRLWLASPRFRYEVKTLQAPEPAVAEAYLKYADAIAELNAVLHPSLLPGPRMQLNQELRTRGLLPESVRRTVEVDRVIDFRAEHEWKWRLEDLDRQYIAKWELELNKGNLRWLKFKELQQEVLSGRLTQR